MEKLYDVFFTDDEALCIAMMKPLQRGRHGNPLHVMGLLSEGSQTNHHDRQALERRKIPFKGFPTPEDPTNKAHQIAAHINAHRAELALALFDVDMPDATGLDIVDALLALEADKGLIICRRPQLKSETPSGLILGLTSGGIPSPDLQTRAQHHFRTGVLSFGLNKPLDLMEGMKQLPGLLAPQNPQRWVHLNHLLAFTHTFQKERL